MSSAHFSNLRKWLVQSPPATWVLAQLRDLLIGALRQGPVPRHVAFVMDGNRRFARNRGIETVEGHNLGFEALARILEVCYKSGVKVVTVYAFSIENFKRPKYEVDALMDMAKIKLTQLAQHGDLLERYGARIQILGQRNLVKADVVEAMDRAVQMTKHNEQAILNVCFPYTSRDEITAAIRKTVIDYSRPVLPQLKRPFSESHISQNIRSRQQDYASEEGLSSKESERDGDPDGSIDSSTTLNHDSMLSRDMRKFGNFRDPEKITSETLDSHMFTADAPPLDLLIRTSGVERLSDFMLWQCHENTSIVFLDCLWPEFDLWQFLPVLLEWQWRRKRLERHHSDKVLRKERLKVQ